MRFPALGLALGLAASASAQDITWDRKMWDPAETPSDLVLPMPCGGAMAFQRVDVGLGAEDGLADRRFLMGRSAGALPVVDYLRYAYLSGAFSEQPGQTHFYLARYEMTAAQHAALTEECTGPPSGRGILAKGGLSWFDGLELARIYTEWLRAEAPDSLPRNGEDLGFLRLPTEPEWEFAVRGGDAVTPSEFAGATFPMSGPIERYGRLAAGSVRGLGPIGRTLANPLGLHDMYGNAEELMLEPFRLNVTGRSHGQAGGLVTRGGSFLTPPAEASSAARSEWATYSRRGTAQAQETFGLRLMISATASGSDAELRDLAAVFTERLEAGTTDIADPLASLSDLIDQEVEPTRRTLLERIRQDLIEAATLAAEADREVAQANLWNAIVFRSNVRDQSELLQQERNLLEQLEEFVLGPPPDMEDDQQREQFLYYEEEMYRSRENIVWRTAERALSMEGYRSVLTLFATGDLGPEVLDAAQRQLARRLVTGGFEAQAVALDRVLEDIETFSRRSEMGEDEFLALVTR